ncbi:Hsp20/alpha crystallin family protein [Fulvivirga maritima]|uniref:Hsp20/alpha crystallin family protein n=1 Tax=Fulvivirga maritima TaxID=2904247 RepID=UPI001F20F4E3|nr:Hsp20/alpha crystallin family protein [Fulvivirga maritima]UII26051.1 Hsp20/alpha crystallin family protein [Fulvivirga maritima]
MEDIMKYDHDMNWVRKVLQSADIMNTFNGGSISPQVQIKKSDNYKQINSRVPGVSPEELRVEVINGNLIIYHNVVFDASQQEFVVPHVVLSHTLEPHIDKMGINANYEDGVLKVILPYDDMQTDFHRNIDIDISM